MGGVRHEVRGRAWPAGAKRMRNTWLDAYTTGGTEVKSRMVATEVAYGNTDESFACTPAEGFTVGGLVGGVKRKETSTLWRLSCTH